jgi:hypothetical protein
MKEDPAFECRFEVRFGDERVVDVRCARLRGPPVAHAQTVKNLTQRHRGTETTSSLCLCVSV